MRSAWVVGLVVVVALSGCFRPLAQGAEPARESARAPPTLFGAAALWLNGTGHVSGIPAHVAALVDPDEPHNCFEVLSTKDDAASYLSGIVVELEWTAASASSQELNVTLRGETGSQFDAPPPALWSMQGPSPLRLSAQAGDVLPVRTPFTVEIRTPTGAVPVPEQTLAFHVGIGVLESDLGSLTWEPCGAIVPAP